MANDLQLLPVSGELAYTWDFSDVIPSTSPLTVTLASVAFTADTPLTVGSQTDDLSNYRSTVIISGAVHAGVYVVQALGTLSNGEVIPKDVTFVCFNA